MQPVTLESILPHLWIFGRSSRAEWWRVHIICAVLLTVFEHMFIARLERGFGGADLQWVSLLWIVVSLALAWVSFASVVRRFHDRGKSGWWALLYLMPFIGWLWILIECGFLPGKPNVTHTFKPAPAPTTTPSPHETARTRMQSAPRASAVQRRERQAWDSKRALKLANVAVRFAIAAVAAFILYKFALDPNTQIFTELTSTFAR